MSQRDNDDFFMKSATALFLFGVFVCLIALYSQAQTPYQNCVAGAKVPHAEAVKACGKVYLKARK